MCIDPATPALEAWLRRIATSGAPTMRLGLREVTAVARHMQLVDGSRIPGKARVITVAGTNGKGSTASLLSHLYTTAGYRVGLTTSPHLVDVRERIQINGQCVCADRLVEAFEAIAQAVDHTGVDLTYFEWIIVAAVWCFVQASVDVIILEVGMGGRLDATNVWDADVAVITSIAWDHMQHLGSTLEAIALEKAGILRPQQVAILGEAVMPSALLDRARHVGVSTLWQAGRHFAWQASTSTHWVWSDPQGIHHTLPRPGVGLDHAAAACAVLHAMRDTLPVDADSRALALSSCAVPGRMTLWQQGSHTVCVDVAHNPAASARLAASLAASPLGEHVSAGRLIALVAVGQRKELAGVLSPLVPHVAQWLVPQWPVDDVMHAPHQVASALHQLGVSRHTIRVCQHLREAWQQAWLFPEAGVLAFGSCKLVGEMYAAGWVPPPIRQKEIKT